MIAIACLSSQVAVAQSPPVVVHDAGPGPTGRYLAMTLAKPGTRVVMADSITITKDSSFPGAIVIIGKRASVSGAVRGDVIVVGGDLFIKPTARIPGRAIAIGGAVYSSLLATVRDGTTSERDFGFDITRVHGTIELRYRELTVVPPESPVQLPGIFGVRIPTYDRSNGLSLPVGPTIALAGGTMSLEPLATYRSQIGELDPSAVVRWRISRTLSLRGTAARETRSNDKWITSDFSNSLNALLIGRDTRNWYRATRGEATVNRLFETPTMAATYRLGGQVERASSARPDSLPTGGPWSLTGKHSVEGMRRANPQIAGGQIASVIGGADYLWNASDVRARLDVGFEAPTSTPTGKHFVQVTIDGQVGFPTLAAQSYRLDAHAILTRGDTAPGQRFGYLGGSGTLATVEPLLSLGGDELLFLESRYIIPVQAIKLPFVGSPTVTLRHILGAAAVQHLPALTQIVGVRVSVLLIRGEVLMDTKTRQAEFHAGLSLVR